MPDRKRPKRAGLPANANHQSPNHQSRITNPQCPKSPRGRSGDSRPGYLLFSQGEAKPRRIAQNSVELTTATRSPSLIRALRPYQWVKNLLVFVPLVSSHRLLEANLALAATLTFVCFCLCASGNYIANDLVDVEADRQHPRKKVRPFAAGAFSVPVAVLSSLALIVAGVSLATSAGRAGVATILVLYVALAMAYSLKLKRAPVTDVFVLTSFYVLRVVAGSVATGIILSGWLLAFALFFFLSLAFVKRYTELQGVDGVMPGRGYTTADGRWMHSIGVSAGYMAVLVLALYINSPEVTKLYSRPVVLWVLCPLLLYWVTRVWYNATRGKMVDDPVLAAVRDPFSYAVGLIGAGVMYAAL